MQAIMEPIFELPYLFGVVILGMLILRNARGRKQFILFGTMAIILGCGDAFHLVPRMWALIVSGDTSLSIYAASLGFGKMVTSITMTIFYVLLYHVWRLRHDVTDRGFLTGLIYLLAITRVVICLLPQNHWLSPDPSLAFGIYRNIPFVLMGILIIVLYAQTGHGKSDAFSKMWLAITLSFIFYVPVVLFADAFPLVGMLMIPKTCAYVWIILMGYWEVKKSV